MQNRAATVGKRAKSKPCTVQWQSQLQVLAVSSPLHALALNETRQAYEPVMWRTNDGWSGNVEQVWFRGTHGDVGGQIAGQEAVRPLSNIPLVWMLERAEACGLTLPPNWRARFPMDVTAPSIGNWRGWGKLFLLRRKRVVGTDPSERLHDSVPAPVKSRWRLLPRRLGFHDNASG